MRKMVMETIEGFSISFSDMLMQMFITAVFMKLYETPHSRVLEDVIL